MCFDIVHTILTLKKNKRKCDVKIFSFTLLYIFSLSKSLSKYTHLTDDTYKLSLSEPTHSEMSNLKFFNFFNLPKHF